MSSCYGKSRKFACFTLDDGYADNYTTAYPIFRKFEIPFSIYVNTGLADGQTVLWWRILEDIIKKHTQVCLITKEQKFELPTRDNREKYRAFETLCWHIRRLSYSDQNYLIDRLLDTYGIDHRAYCRSFALSWNEIAELATDNLVSIGAHTVHHPVLSKLPEGQVRKEIEISRDRIAEKIGCVPEHLCYPYGDRGSAGTREFNIAKELGFKTATTTRKGLIFPQHKNHLHALPRVSLNGDYQQLRYIKVLLSGVPFALYRPFRRLDVH